MRSDLGAEIVADALAMAVAGRQPAAGVIPTADRSTQACAWAARWPHLGSRACAVFCVSAV
jgi:hypothetical protein